jgi:16S rRNA (cytosine967-C5)-methyltransferase
VPATEAIPSLALLEHAAAVMSRLLRFEQPADAALSAYFREHAELGARDRAFIADTAFGVLRRLRTLRAVANDTSARRLVLAYLARIAGLSLRQLDPLLRPQDQSWLAQAKSIPIESLTRAERADLPDWLAGRWLEEMPEEEMLELAQACNTPAPLDLRVNTLLADRDEILAALHEEGLAATATPLSPVGIRLAGKPPIQRHPLFLSGKIEVQDEGSQLLAYLLAPRRGEMVCDFCAGAGGKTLALGAVMHSTGRIYALDVSEKRLAKLKPRLKRSGLSNVHPQRITGEGDARIKRLSGKLDRVLVDVPCSGLGTLRRNPDLKWRQSPESVAELATKQAAILRAASRLIKPGGRLVYATCSLLPEENENQVTSFLNDRPDFHIVSAQDVLAGQHIGLDCGEYFRVDPLHHGCDGFFAAILERSK